MTARPSFFVCVYEAFFRKNGVFPFINEWIMKKTREKGKKKEQ